jgi:hypothetical protein
MTRILTIIALLFATPAAAESSLQQVVDFFFPLSWTMLAPLLMALSPLSLISFPKREYGYSAGGVEYIAANDNSLK